MVAKQCVARGRGTGGTHAFWAEPFALRHRCQLLTVQVPGQAASVAKDELPNVAAREAEVLML